MARKPDDHAWFGFTCAQGEFLDFLDHLGNNAWDRNSQADEIMPKMIREAQDLALSMSDVKRAMESIGYERDALRQLDRRPYALTVKDDQTLRAFPQRCPVDHPDATTAAGADSVPRLPEVQTFAEADVGSTV